MLSGSAGCKSKPHRSLPSTASVVEVSAEIRLKALAAKSWLVDLEVPGFGKAALAVPLGAISPRPIVVALHGVADRPEWSCGAFRGIAGPASFVLCPRGILRADLPQAEADPRYTFGPSDDTSRELRAALGALKRSYGTYVAPGPVLFGGFEVGADQAAWIARQEPAFFSRLLLIEPADSAWSVSDAALFGRLGGARVLFATCPREGRDFGLKALLTQRAGAEARSVEFPPSAPPLGAAAVSLLAQSFSWLASPVKPKSGLNLAGNPLSAREPAAPPFDR